MSGIAGFCNHRADYATERGSWNAALKNMRDSIAHRGGDYYGEYLRGRVGLTDTRPDGDTKPDGDARLSVRVADGAEYAVAFSGKIYNTEELKRSLPTGLYASGDTDAEMILRGYISRGVDFFKRLNGVFAFALWDGGAKNLVLCRDCVGVLPLFYTLRGDTLVFGSEIKALFRFPGVKPEADMDSFREIFGLGPARTPGCGVFKGIYEVEPGQCAVFSADGLKTRRYWRLESKEHADGYDETVETVSFLVRDAIIRQIPSDGPVCSLLSGGVDSSVVTAVTADHLRKNGARLDTFSFDFSGNDVYFQSNAFQPERDISYVKKVLEIRDCNHTFLECGEDELADLLTAAADARDLPGMADIDASLLYFCPMVSRYDKVALTGECSDELGVTGCNL